MVTSSLSQWVISLAQCDTDRILRGHNGFLTYLVEVQLSVPRWTADDLTVSPPESRASANFILTCHKVISCRPRLKLGHHLYLNGANWLSFKDRCTFSNHTIQSYTHRDKLISRYSYFIWINKDLLLRISWAYQCLRSNISSLFHKFNCEYRIMQ